ncbi:MAG: HPr kinase/phosphorylase [Rhizobiaceae bacterium]|nr:MAG: HPr kinase/phosphorylase [Rhizobiaceae bacterium]CAG0971265.1 HPr kinase/phosphorylase [Rhizobiaceae bacterium]
MALLQLHATTALLGDRGVLIAGDSGAGKSTLALALVRRCIFSGRFATLVADDRTDIKVCGGRILAAAPRPLAGLVEVHGLGPRSVDHERRAVVDLLVRLVEPGLAPRYQEGDFEAVAGCLVSSVALPQRQAELACSVVLSWLDLPPF